MAVVQVELTIVEVVVAAAAPGISVVAVDQRQETPVVTAQVVAAVQTM